ncbi:hypothetical protein QNO08_09270 [Arthrobacter sp. zg-Y820]|uniref:hypothetical protein n=1 Tax=unclassified Arthrobacter TaxID=235627 RepID=UPI001E28DD22|nr:MULTISPECIES: hypothetical protein [unclassified Arthrobacter]MCC9196693.1 hypothetical protein [Arthrobacter sp. zg-Y820]MDK1279555.1 hypothetical protein [Arthrobacter sp. zg.Y820]MDK1358827.1 hypothetical protein [Arthrobacter sp. zg-Y1219]WIB08071.1 hypothetical protein QNO08_09270 [Arthrobacter sp. zg-Y820]
MPWWSWILIWAALIVAAAAFYALIGWRIFRKLMATLREAETAVSSLAVSAPAAAPPAEKSPDAELGIFADPILVKVRYEEGKEARQAGRRERRISRRLANGQPRALRDFPGL